MLLARLLLQIKALNVKEFGKVVLVACAILSVFGNGLTILGNAKALNVIEKPIAIIAWLKKNVTETDIVISNSHYMGYWLDRRCLYLPKEWWHGRVFSAEDARHCADAERQVWLAALEKDRVFAYDGGAYVNEMVRQKEGELYELRTKLVDGEVYLFRIAENEALHGSIVRTDE